MVLLLSRSFISFSSNKVRGSLLSGSVLRRCGGLIIVGDVSGSCKIPKLHLKLLTDKGGSLIGCVEQSLSV